MVDQDRIALMLQRVLNELMLLRESAAAERSGVRSDAVHLAAVKYKFVTTIEGVINVAQHICATEGSPPAHRAGRLTGSGALAGGEAGGGAGS